MLLRAMFGNGRGDVDLVAHWPYGPNFQPVTSELTRLSSSRYGRPAEIGLILTEHWTTTGHDEAPGTG
jgi:hypothetical protein